MDTGDFRDWHWEEGHADVFLSPGQDQSAVQPTIVRWSHRTELHCKKARAKLMPTSDFSLASPSGLKEARHIRGFFSREQHDELLKGLSGLPDGLYGKHRIYRKEEGWSARTADEQESFHGVFAGLLPRIKEVVKGYNSLEYGWIDRNLKGAPFEITTTAYMATTGAGDEGKRHQQAHLDDRNTRGVSVVVVMGDFDGGEVVFPEKDVAFRPLPGDLYLFNAASLKHVVSRVTRGFRRVVIFFTHETSIYN